MRKKDITYESERKIKTVFGNLTLRGRVWQAHVNVRTGQYLRVSTGHYDRNKALQRLEEIWRENASQKFFEKSNIKRTFEDLAALYCKDKKPSKNDFWYINEVVNHFGKFDPIKIRRREILDYQDFLTNKKKHKSTEAITDNTKWNHIAKLKVILRYGAEIEWYSLNDLPIIKIPSRLTFMRTRIPTKDELTKIISNIDSEHFKTAFMLALYTGMRSKEIFNLTWDKIDFDTETIFLTPKDTKTSNPRWIPILPELLKELNRRPKNSIYVVTYNGQPIKSLKTTWNTIKRNAKICDLHFHDLRHWARAFFRQAGAREELIVSVLGHQTIDMSRKYDVIVRKDFEEMRNLCTHFAQSELGIKFD